MDVTRYDRSVIKATRNDEGYLVDSPVVGRVGIQVYKNADGTIRRELRPADEVFKADSLATFAGKPITDDHRGVVTSKNAKAVTVGMMRSPGRQDGDNVVTDIIVFDEQTIDKAINGGKRELSLGYKVDLEETPGEWNGQRYDAIQRNIRVNHLAIVPRGRAGNARLNLDRLDAVSFNPQEEDIMPEALGRIRLDGGLEYPAAPEVVIAIERLRTDLATAQTAATTANAAVQRLEGERDTLKARVDAFPAELATARTDAVKEAEAAAKARSALEKVATKFKVDCAGKTDRQVKELVIKTVRTDADLSDKTDAYIDAAFDMAADMKADVAIKNQREAVNKREDGNKEPEVGSYAGFMSKLGKQEN